MKKIVILPCIYTMIMGIGLFITHEWMNVTYGKEGFIPALFPFLLILSVFSVLAYRKYGQELEPIEAKINLFYLLFIPTVLIALFSLVHTFSLSTSFFLTFFGTILVGIGEEALYRGVVFTRAAKHWGVINGILFSSLAFSLLHAVNVLGGMSVGEILMQLVNTFLMGIFFAVSYYFTRNLVMMIIFHGLWDYIVLSSVTTLYPIISGVMILLLLILIILTILMLHKIYRERSFH